MIINYLGLVIWFSLKIATTHTYFCPSILLILLVIIARIARAFMQSFIFAFFHQLFFSRSKGKMLVSCPNTKCILCNTVFGLQMWLFLCTILRKHL
uniref:Serine/threonine-protein kinase tricorner n=1 Tax=Rhizophora mucronata TaxID=61149 RepID=A0A2P2JKB7_RHIMU